MYCSSFIFCCAGFYSSQGIRKQAAEGTAVQETKGRMAMRLCQSTQSHHCQTHTHSMHAHHWRRSDWTARSIDAEEMEASRTALDMMAQRSRSVVGHARHADRRVSELWRWMDGSSALSVPAPARHLGVAEEMGAHLRKASLALTHGVGPQQACCSRQEIIGGACFLVHWLLIHVLYYYCMC
jgi:hypothetical protein